MYQTVLLQELLEQTSVMAEQDLEIKEITEESLDKEMRKTKSSKISNNSNSSSNNNYLVVNS